MRSTEGAKHGDEPNERHGCWTAGNREPFAGRSGQVPAAQDVQGRQAPREEQAAQPIGPKQLSEATQVLLKYKSGKAALDRRIVENEHWYRLHRDTEDGNFADSGWMFNSLANKHADAMDNYPEPNVLPRARDDADTAKELSSILPVALDQNDYEQVYSDAWWYKLKHGTAVKGVFWNGAKDGGLGDIDLRLVDLLNLYWEPGITDIQASRNVFHVELVDNEVILEQWPFAKNHLGQGLTAQRYQYDESIDTSDKKPCCGLVLQAAGRAALLQVCGRVCFVCQRERRAVCRAGLLRPRQVPVCV